MAVGRFSLAFNDGTPEVCEVCVIIDRFGVFPSARGMSAEEITSTCVSALLQDALQLIATARPKRTGGNTYIQVPQKESFAPLVGCLQANQLNAVDTPSVQRNGVNFATFA